MATTKAQQRAVNKYSKKAYDRIVVLVRKGERQKIADYAKENGYKSTNEFITTAISEVMEKDNNIEV